MSALVYGAVKLTFGFLANKIRDDVVKRLEDGDVTNEQCRKLIVRELDDIHRKLDALARKDLSSSLCFLQEGINRLYNSLSQLDSNENSPESIENQIVPDTASRRRESRRGSQVKKAIAFIDVLIPSQIRLNDRFKTAIESFKFAREKATDAFANTVLPTEDRIQATQIRMMARILEGLEDPEASVSDCVQYLKQLHDVGAVQGIFFAQVNGGITTRFGKAKRCDDATSVHQTNEILFKFARKLTKWLSAGIFSQWPAISLTDRRYGEDSLDGIRKETVQVPEFDFNDDIRSEISVVNSRGEIIALTRSEHSFKIFKPSGESRTLYATPREHHAANCFEIAMDIDADDNVYLITTFQDSTQKRSYKLYVFDENGSGKFASPLYFLQSRLPLVRMAISNDGKIAILNCKKKLLYIGRVRFELNSFEVNKKLSLKKLEHPVSLKFPPELNETKIIVADSHTIHIYAENGRRQQKINMDRAMNICSFALDYINGRFLVKTYHSSGCNVLRFASSTGDLELIDSLCFGSSEWIIDANLICHPKGPVALVRKTGATLLQL